MTLHPLRLLLPLLLAGTTACSTALTPHAAPPPARSLKAYTSEAELDAALTRWRQASERQRQEAEEQRRLARLRAAPAAAAPPAPAQPPAPMLQSAPLAESAVSAKASVSPAQGLAGAAADSITNVQTAGVDEGGIVKNAGEHLVILRRGRLFTVKVGADELRPVSTVDAFAPGADPRGAWYDELLIHGSTVVVVGYSYARGGTEIGLFELGRDGGLAYRATYHLRSNDYYSSRNYASRLVGSQLIFYTPSVMAPWGTGQQSNAWPAMRRWFAGTPEEFRRILPATRIHRSDDEFEPGQPIALHTVTRCDISAQPLRCESSAVLGPAGRVFYVAANSVYVWAATQQRRWPYGWGGTPDRPAPSESRAVLFRLPLDGGAPSGIKAVGMPIDQMSFLEDAAHLNVLLRDEGRGESMWGGERGAARLALLRLPLALLGDGTGVVAREHYRRLPGGTGAPGGGLQNRHVGEWLVWASGEQAWATRPATSDEAISLTPGHRVERIEALGRDAVLVGNAGNELRFSALRLDPRPALAGHFTRPGARQGETRTHGFFYRPLGNDEGLLGLPILGQGNDVSLKSPQGRHGAASVVFLRQRHLQFTGLGELAAMPREAMFNDGCKASCVDWYGNARPIFLGGRVFALMGYELVEGRIGARVEAIEERRRVDFTPHATSRDGRPSPFQ